MTNKDICGCKGIRTCLLCEKLKDINTNLEDETRIAAEYTFCPDCQLCWPFADSVGNVTTPLYVGRVKLFLEFLTLEEELAIVNAIDKIAWVPSQSGRQKQDFGPKVNFKKKKGKLGNFKGFPLPFRDIVEKLKEIDELSNFLPVELCNLDYSPDRGSAIDPHIDDSWIWGERLVTVNLMSSTVLTLTPAYYCRCSCSSELSYLNCDLSEFCKHCNHSVLNPHPDCHNVLPSKIPSNHHSSLDSSLKFGNKAITDLCSMLRNQEQPSVSVRITLPPRSLLILSGCARHNWFHEIKRKDVTSRRLAMTFRELSSEFLENGKESEFGFKLLSTARHFYDLDN